MKTEVTKILHALLKGQANSSEDLLPLVYQELRELAHARMKQELHRDSLDATELVHDAYLRLINTEEPICWESRGHFFAAAAEAMRRILVERARKRKALKRGGALNRVELEADHVSSQMVDEKLLALSDAIDKLDTLDPDRAKLVNLRYFAGFTVAQASEVLGISKTKAERSWAYTRAWLQNEMTEL